MQPRNLPWPAVEVPVVVVVLVVVVVVVVGGGGGGAGEVTTYKPTSTS